MPGSSRPASARRYHGCRLRTLREYIAPSPHVVLPRASRRAPRRRSDWQAGALERCRYRARIGESARRVADCYTTRAAHASRGLYPGGEAVPIAGTNGRAGPSNQGLQRRRRSGEPDAGHVRAQDRARAALAGVAGGEKGGEATCHRGDHEDGPCLKGDIHHPTAGGQGVGHRR